MVTPRLTRHARVSFLRLRPTSGNHDVTTQMAVAQRLAGLLGCEFLGDAAPGHAPPVHGYAVPDDTVLSLEAARSAGIRAEDDLFGGVVPWPYMAGKTITHSLVRPRAAAPPGWSAAFPVQVRDAVLPGYSAFAGDDVALAASDLLRDGAVRLKPADARGGAGQHVVPHAQALDRALSALGAERVARGVVVERNLVQVRTFSVGNVRVGWLEASYVGEQRTTPNHHGQAVYGGSALAFVRGGVDRLVALIEDAELRGAIDRAGAFHVTAMRTLGGAFASRCNYDVAAGVDDRGRRHMGVLEQSWRIGGASPAEVLALEAFAGDASLQTVRAATVETYGHDVAVPPGAWITYRGVDPHVGALTKYATVASD
jgi:hypothetical protein